LADSLSSCTLRFEEGHLPYTMSLTSAATLGRTKDGQLSIRQKKEARFELRVTVCSKTKAVHLERQAASARRAGTLKADRCEAVKVQKRADTHRDVANVNPAARVESIVHVADAMTGPHALAAFVTNPRGAACHRAYAGDIGSGMAEYVALLTDGATQAGNELGDLASATGPISSVVRRGIRKRL